MRRRNSVLGVGGVSETRFTPGPWKALTNGNTFNSATVVTSKDAADGWVCEVFDDSDSCTLPDEANAHLIAAAPELYDALETLLDINDNGGPFGGELYQDRVVRSIECARKALAKARGEA